MAALVLISASGCMRQAMRETAPTAAPPSVERPAPGAAKMAAGKGPKGPEVEVALAFARELHDDQYQPAYARLSPGSRESLSPEEWRESLDISSDMAKDQFFPFALFYASEYSVGEVEIEGEHANAMVTLSGSKPVPIRLVQEEGSWWVDWTDESQVRGSLEQALGALVGGEGSTGMMMAMAEGMGATAMMGLGSPLFAQCGAVSSVKEGEGAVVQVVGTGTMQAVFPVRKHRGAWHVDWSHAEVVGEAAPEARGGEAAQTRLGEARERAQQSACLSNLKQLALATLMYAQDYDEVFPPADKWCDGVMPYLRNEELFKCPSDPQHDYSYAFNRNLGGKRLGQIPRPAETVLIFDSTAGKKNAADAGESWPEEGRHNGGNNCAWADGHARWTQEKPDFSP